MTVQRILAIFGGLVVLGGITVVVTNPASAQIIQSVGTVFVASLRTAMGR